METNTQEKFNIKTEIFEGPLDLLLNLIESEKLDITSISLAKVSDHFTNYVGALKDADTEVLSDFLDIASKLILIKSKVLLPQLVLTQEEEEDINELERRLKEYQIFKRVSKEIEVYANSEHRGFSRKTKSTPDITLFDPPQSIDQDKLFEILKEVLSRVPKEELKEKTEDAVIEPAVSMDEKIEEISKHFVTHKTFSFSEFLRSAKTKTEIIVSFLAILELLRLKKIDFNQDDNFSDIIITKQEEVLTIHHEG
ncbi:segregation/condensation protein A [bacterium]|nr:segregation/condensation protein A [bacterium]